VLKPNRRAKKNDTKKDENMKEITSKIARVDQINVGGVPPVDGKWETWAESVVKRPMPIVYKLTGIWEMMDTKEQKDAFKDAIEDIYRIVLDPPQIDTTYLKSFHFGVSGPDGTLVSDYSYSSNFEYRALLSVGDTYTPDAPDVNKRSYISFDVVWEGRSQSAVFATSINNLLSPSYEDKEKASPIIDTQWASYFNPFGLSGGTLGQSTIQFRALGSGDLPPALYKNSLQRFSFLTATTSSDKKLVSGLIHPGGFAVSDNFNAKIPFDVSKPEKTKWLIEFEKEFDKAPTIVLFPVWFPPPAENTVPSNSTNKPNDVLDILMVSNSCTTRQCNVDVGFSSNEFLGFSFLAIDGNLTNAPGVVHGTVDVKSAIGSVTKVKSGYNETYYFDKANTIASLVGVEIIFDRPFVGIPSVIASIHDSIPSLRGSLSQSIIVDHITRKSAFIKVGMVYPENFIPLSFAFVAVGPVDAKRQ